MTAPATRPRTVLVTGAAGFIGSTLCRRLLAAGHRVFGYDDLCRGRAEYVPSGVQLIRGDVRNRAQLDEAVSQAAPDCVVHLAAMHFIPDCLARPGETLDVNVEGTRCVLESCRRAGRLAFVFASSAAVYAPTGSPCVEDETPLRPIDIYGESKVLAEQLVVRFHEETGRPATILRLFNAVGRRETNPHVIPHIFESLRASDGIALGDLTPQRDYIDTRDVADAMLTVVDSPAGLRVLNVGTGVGHAVGEVVEMLRRLLGRSIVVAPEPSRMRPSERMLLVANVEKMRRATGWTPRIPLEETLLDLVDAYGLTAPGQERRPVVAIDGAANSNATP